MVNAKMLQDKVVRKAMSMKMSPEKANEVIGVVNDISRVPDDEMELMEGILMSERVNKAARDNGNPELIVIDENGNFSVSKEEIIRLKALAARMAKLDKKQMELFGYIVDLTEKQL